MTTGEESNLLRLGDSTKTTQQKRQDYRTAKSAPQSLEFVVKKPIAAKETPAVQIFSAGVPEHVPEIDPGLEEDLIPPTVNLLEVPSR